MAHNKVFQRLSNATTLQLSPRDRGGHIGRGNRTSPCLTLEELEKARALERFVGYGQQGHQGLGFRCEYRKVDTRTDIINRMKQEAEDKRLIFYINTNYKPLGFPGG